MRHQVNWSQQESKFNMIKVNAMSEQKNKLIIVITIAIVSVLLLGGVSFTFFPSQTKPTSTPQLTISANSIDQAFVPTANLSFQIVGGYSVNSSLSSANVYPVGGLAFVVSDTHPLDGITIEPDRSIDSTSCHSIQRSGNVYTLTGDITNQTIIVNRSNMVIDGAGCSLQGWNNGYTYALENFDLQYVHDVTIKNFNISLSWQGIWVQNFSNITIQAKQFSKHNDLWIHPSYSNNNTNIISNTSTIT